jgi:preprotein translocase subunit SecE
MKNSVESRIPKAASKKKRTNIIKFARDVRAEMKKVTWMTRQQLVNSTLTVLVLCTIVAVIIFLADQVFSKLSVALFG